MALQKYVYIFQDPESNEFVTFLDDFYHYFDEQCKRQNIHVRRSFVLRSFKSVKKNQDKDAVSVKELLRYCFNHCEDYDACKEIVQVVEKAVLFNKTSSDSQYVRSSLELYKLIAKSKFDNLGILQQLEVGESTVPTLMTANKDLFTDSEWKKIVWFEFHFSKDISNEELSYEDLIQLKWNKYSGLLSFDKCKNQLEKITRKHLKHRFQRREAARREESEQIIIGQTHLYSVIDSHITSLLQDNYPEAFGFGVVFENNYEKKEDGLCVVVEVTSGVHVNEDVYRCLSLTINYDLQKRHRLHLKNVIYLHTDTVGQYLKGDGHCFKISSKR